MYDTLDFTLDHGVATIRLNRPDRLNAINRLMIADLTGLCQRLDDESGLRAVVLTGNGRAFCAGADITVLDTIESAADALDFIAAIQRMTNAIEALKVPVIAAINGVAYGGGCEIALACDLRLMTPESSIGVPEIKIGLLPGAGGTQRLARMLPPAIAKELIYLGDPISAEVAAAHGLINRVIAETELLAEAAGMADRLAALPPLGLRAAKQLANGAALYGLQDGIAAERQAVAGLFVTEDGHEGLRAFLEKRAPRFTGR